MSKKLLFFLLILGFFACGDEAAEEQTNIQQEQLAQRWELYAAQRNGKNTDTMRDAYLDLKADGSGVINLDGNGQDAQWSVEGNALKISGTQTDMLSTDYMIKELKDSLLHLSVELRDTPFEMQFKIAEEEEELQ